VGLWPFLQAREYVHKLSLKNQSEWNEYCKSGKRPVFIPSVPSRLYKEHWKGWGDWLGTGYVANFEREYPPFEEARKMVHSFDLKSQSEWRHFLRSGKKPIDIPSNPARTYKKEWKGFGDWLGTGRTRDFLDFEEARKMVHSLRLGSKEDWGTYVKSGKKPEGYLLIPHTYTRKSGKVGGIGLVLASLHIKTENIANS
jgi:Integrase repeat unit